MAISWPRSNQFDKTVNPNYSWRISVAMKLIRLRQFTTKDAKSTKENRFCLKTEKKKRFLRDLRALRGKYFFYASSVPRVITLSVQSQSMLNSDASREQERSHAYL